MRACVLSSSVSVRRVSIVLRIRHTPLCIPPRTLPVIRRHSYILTVVYTISHTAQPSDGPAYISGLDTTLGILSGESQDNGSAVCKLATVEIQGLIQQREVARRSRDFVTGDALRDQLRNAGVNLRDNDNSWSTHDGRRGSYAGEGVSAGGGVAPGSEGTVPAPFVGDSDGAAAAATAAAGLAPGAKPTQEQIQQAVCQRETARKSHDWSTADAMREQLRAWGIHLNDTEKEWVLRRPVEVCSGRVKYVACGLGYFGIGSHSELVP